VIEYGKMYSAKEVQATSYFEDNSISPTRLFCSTFIPAFVVRGLPKFLGPVKPMSLLFTQRC
jgi:hypothetical protein